MRFFMKGLSSLIIVALLLLLSATTSAQDADLMSLYHDAIKEMGRPLKKEDFRPFGRNTAQDYNELAQMYLEAGKYSKALEYTMKALELNDLDPIANLNAGLIYYELVDYDKAVYHLKWALWIERRSDGPEEPRLGRELLATSEPSSYLAIMALIDKASAKAEEEAKYARLEREYDAVGVPRRPLTPETAKKQPAVTKTPKEEGRKEAGKKPTEKKPAEKGPTDLLLQAAGRVGMRQYISEIYTAEGKDNKAMVVVKRTWGDVPYIKKLEFIDKLWARWQGIKRKTGDKLGIYRIAVVDSDDQVIGGSNWLNTKVWSMKP